MVSVSRALVLVGVAMPNFTAASAEHSRGVRVLCKGVRLGVPLVETFLTVSAPSVRASGMFDLANELSVQLPPRNGHRGHSVQLC